MSDYLASLIRTWVPLGVAVLIAWLSSLGIHVSDDTRSALVSGIGALVAALYYAAVRLLEQRWPWLGLLLGTTKAPTTYSAPVVSLAAWRARRAQRKGTRRHAA